MPIKNIVISGGGPSGLISYGAIKKLHQLEVWKQSELSAIYATSIGGLIGFLILLDLEWSIIDDYLIERPWVKAFEQVKTDILEVIYNKGINGEQMAAIFTKPLLTSKELPIDITLQHLYDKTNIELCLTAVDLNSINGITTELISYKTYPNMTLNCALACTSAVPMIFKPVFYNNKCFIDGGMTNNFPLSLCIADTKCKHSEILAFSNIQNNNVLKVRETSSIVEYGRIIMNKLHCEIETSKNQPVINNILYIDQSDVFDITTWYSVLDSGDKRRELIERGETTSATFFKELNSRQETAEDCPAEV